jgi:hypothetical protein
MKGIVYRCENKDCSEHGKPQDTPGFCPECAQPLRADLTGVRPSTPPIKYEVRRIGTTS